MHAIVTSMNFSFHSVNQRASVFFLLQLVLDFRLSINILRISFPSNGPSFSCVSAILVELDINNSLDKTKDTNSILDQMGQGCFHGLQTGFHEFLS